MDEDLFERRKRIGMSQFKLAQDSGISRMRLSLAETGQVYLSGKEVAALRRAVNRYIAQKAREIAQLLSEADRETAEA